MPPVQMIPVRSSWVHSYGYDAHRERLYVAYAKQAGRGVVVTTCRYDDVPLAMWQDFQAAPSKGRWVHANVYHLPYVIV